MTGTPIVHLGLGAFARAHLATYAEDLIAAGHDARITAVSLRTATVVDALAAQGHRYTVVERDGAEAVREVRSIVASASGPAAAVAAVADPACRLVTLTVTEAGYGIVAGTAGAEAVLDVDRPDVAADLRLLGSSDPAGPEDVDVDALATVAGVLVAALARRWAAGAEAPVVASLDNVASNGATLRAAVVAMAAVADEALAGWIGDLVAFPSSVVDRIVPATPPKLSAHLASVHGIDDAVPILTEPHRSWAIEAVDGLDPWDLVGVEVVDDVSAHERRKLWMLNGPHSAAAIAGLARGHETIAEAVADPVVRALVVAVAADAVEVADLPAALDGERFAAEVLDRFANPVLGHRCAQVATDSEHKLPLRIVPVLEERLARGRAPGAGARVVATWLVGARDPDGARLLGALTPAARAAVAAAEPVDGRSADVASR